MVDGKVNEVEAVRHDLRPSMGGMFGWVHLCKRGWHSTRGRHPEKRGAKSCRQDDGVIRTPRSTTSHPYIADGDGKPTGDCNAPKLATKKKRERAAVRRPERIGSILRAWQGLG